jgi:nucleoside-diphosphate-sugar epimerase/SAM-dependent methyltransferase
MFAYHPKLLPVVLAALLAVQALQPLGCAARAVHSLPRTHATPRAHLVHRHSTQHRVAIIGAAGYVGAALQDYLTAQGHDVTGYDRDPRQMADRVQSKASWDVSRRELASYDVVIYFGGLTGRVLCDTHPDKVQAENIDDIADLSKRMTSKQLLIFASTSAVNEGSGADARSEDGAIDDAKLDRYSLSLAMRERVLHELSRSRAAPQMVGLRFGTVVGRSPSQRLDLVHMALMCQAYLYGHIVITHAESHESMLSMPDLTRAIDRIITARHLASLFDVYQLCSFNTNVEAVANAVASKTGAHLHFSDSPSAIDGFSMNCTKFERTFNFKFQDSQASVLEDMNAHIDTMCTGREITHRHGNESVPCTVCGSRDLQTVLDMGEQPLANDFAEDVVVAQQRERYPLKLMRCRQCQHAQMSHIVDRERVFSNYNYQSGTSATLAKYFEFVVDKIVKETGKQVGTVLEIASNDGTQLDKFKARGWHTHGVDPAANLVRMAAKKGHHVQVGFWGQKDVPNLPDPASVDAIVAQNVLAHVPDPLAFVTACSKAMGPDTLLYLQTSQCEMMEGGQFDTAYHEHISFFSGHSFQKLAQLAGMKIVSFEVTPIHGKSCLVTMKKTGPDNSPTLAARLASEESAGLTTDWFYVQFRARAAGMRDWIHKQLTSLHGQNYEIVAYGAAAKGMVLLHFLRSLATGPYEFEYVVDDAPMKQGTFCPGTTIAVKPTSALGQGTDDRPMAILIFSWNFKDEVLANIRKAMHGTNRRVLAILPFPDQQIIQVFPAPAGAVEPVLTNPVHPQTYPAPWQSSPCPVVAVTHFYNEHLLLPYWIRHHASLFDAVLLIDYHSTDASVKLLKALAPSSWNVVASANAAFEASAVDAEVAKFEARFPECAWKIALTTTEFLVHPNLRAYMHSLDATNASLALRFPGFIMVGDDANPLTTYAQLVTQRSVAGTDPTDQTRVWSASMDDYSYVNRQYSRFMHRKGVNYGIGRHSIDTQWHLSESGFIAKFQWTPWPQIKDRKLQIQTQIPDSDRAKSYGSQHIATPGQLEQSREHALATSATDLSATDVCHSHATNALQARRDWYRTTLGPVSFQWDKCVKK